MNEILKKEITKLIEAEQDTSLLDFVYKLLLMEGKRPEAESPRSE